MNEIITSSTKADHSSGFSEFPWMIDGAGLPPNAAELLPKLVSTILPVKVDLKQWVFDMEKEIMFLFGLCNLIHTYAYADINQLLEYLVILLRVILLVLALLLPMKQKSKEAVMTV